MMKAHIIAWLLLVSNSVFAQLYINTDVTVQNGATLFAQDTIWVDPLAVVRVQGILETTKSINTSIGYVNTENTGFLITPIQPGATKNINIGAGTNNAIGLTHSSSGAVVFKLGVRNQVFGNPQNNTTLLSNDVVNATWHIEPLSSATNTIVRVGWNSPNESAGFNRAASFIGYWQQGVSTSWNPASATSVAINTGGVPEFTLTSNANNLNTGIHYYGVGSTGSVLPVQLLGFEANKVKDHVLLTWQTASEKNNAYFEIERSADGEVFETIAPKVKGQGTTQIRHDYAFTDEDASTFAKNNGPTIYYRLKQVDVDGTFVYSEIRSIDMVNSIETMSVQPNPFNEQANVVLQSNQSGKAAIVVTDVKGSVVLSQQSEIIEGYNLLTLVNAEMLQSGMYFVTVKYGTETKVMKLVKNN